MGENAMTSRRRFLQTLAGLGAFSIVPRHVLGGPGYVAPSDKTTLAGIGTGGQGLQNMTRFVHLPEVQVLAVCDVERECGGYLSWNWSQGLEQRVSGREPTKRMVEEYYAQRDGVGSYRGCATYVDFRELLDKEDVDAVMVATPDHVHAVATLAALKRGKHVYCEKPLAYTVQEVRAVVEAARQAGVATQLGNQGQADEDARLIQEFLLDNAIGPVHELHHTSPAPFWDPPAWGHLPPETPPVPEGLDWDLWLGPAPERPYHPAYHPWRWRDWRGFGTSPLGDLGCHVLSTPVKALKLAHPTTIEAEADDMGPAVYPRRFRVRWEFPARDEMPPLTLIWYHGGWKPPRPPQLEPGRALFGDLYIGESGVLMDHRLIPETEMQRYGRPPRKLARSIGHDQEFIAACRGGPPAGSDFVRHAGMLTEIPLLGNIAVKLGRKLTWDGPNQCFPGDPEATALLHREYRAGWGV